MTLAGVDIYVWATEVDNVPKNQGKFTLKLISNRGTKIYPPPAPEIKLIDWFRCRYLSEQSLVDADIDSLCKEITSAGFIWNKAQKLYQIDGVNAYSEPY